MPMRLIDRVRTESWECVELRITQYIVKHFPPPLACVIADDVAGSILTTEWDLSGLPLILPYPSLWIEVMGPNRMAAGWHLREVPSGFEIICFGAVRNGRVRVAPGYVKVTATREGEYKDRKIFIPNSLSDESKRELNESMSKSSLIAIVAVGLMNCRNIQTVNEPRPPPRLEHKFQKRTGKPFAKVSRIVLPGNVRHARTVAEAMNNAVPLHKVRAHSKTYTEDKPLMGKHAGTFFWGFQVRGAAEHGVREPEYHLRDAPDVEQ